MYQVIDNTTGTTTYDSEELYKCRVWVSGDTDRYTIIWTASIA